MNVNSIHFCGKDFKIGDKIIRQILSKDSFQPIFNRCHFRFFLNKDRDNYKESLIMCECSIGWFVLFQIDRITNTENSDSHGKIIVDVFGSILGEPFEIVMKYKLGDIIDVKISMNRRGEKRLNPVCFHEECQLYFFNLEKEQNQEEILQNAFINSSWKFRILSINATEFIGGKLAINVYGYFFQKTMIIEKRYKVNYHRSGNCLVYEESWSGDKFIKKQHIRHCYTTSLFERSRNCTKIFRTVRIYADSFREYLIGVSFSEMSPREYSQMLFKKTGIMPNIKILPIHNDEKLYK